MSAQEGDFLYTTNSGTITIAQYIGSGGEVRVPDEINGLPVTCLGDEAFYSVTNLAAVAIPNTVTNIGNSVFLGCTSLAGITLPDSVKAIGMHSFYLCHSLKSVLLPKSLISIGEKAFSRCDNLMAIRVDTANPAYCDVEGVLFDRTQETLVLYPAGVSGFYSVPGGVSTIGNSAFAGSKNVVGVTLPPGVTRIGEFAFASCVGMTFIGIPDSVTSIEASAFMGCSGLTNVEIPGSVKTIGQRAFSYCSGLKEINVDPANPYYCAVDGFLFDRSRTILLQAPGAISGTYVVPQSVTEIGGYAFAWCFQLKAICFQGDAPLVNYTFVQTPAVIYYLPGTSGWRTEFGNRPTALWKLPYPLVLNSSAAVRGNEFGFVVSWATNVPVVVEASESLADAAWSVVSTNTLAGGWSYFHDSDWTNYPSRVYRVRSL